MGKECAGAPARAAAEEQPPPVIMDCWSWIASARAAARRAVDAGLSAETPNDGAPDQRDKAVT